MNKILHVPLWTLILAATLITVSYIVIVTGHNKEYKQVFKESEAYRIALEKCQSQAYAREAKNEADSLVHNVESATGNKPAKEYLSKFKTKK